MTRQSLDGFQEIMKGQGKGREKRLIGRRKTKGKKINGKKEKGRERRLLGRRKKEEKGD